jgi:hypothetical protein
MENKCVVDFRMNQRLYRTSAIGRLLRSIAATVPDPLLTYIARTVRSFVTAVQGPS